MTDNTIEGEDWQVQRDAHKAVGDDAFRSSQFADAILHYTTALTMDPTHAILLSNRSAAYLKHGERSKALRDAESCVKENPDFIKGYSRLGAAQQSLNRWGLAKEAYEHVLCMEVDNVVAKQGLQDCNKKLDAAKKQEEEEKVETIAKGQEQPKGEDDLLDDFFDEVETVATAKTSTISATTTESLLKVQKKDLGTAQSQSERLLAPNYKWRNLNPFYVLDLPHTATNDDISRRYKALSLLLHPDKCNLPPEAYDEVQRAKRQLDDEDKNRHVRALCDEGMKLGATLFSQQKKNNSTTLEELQTREILRVFAEVEMKRKEVEERERKYEQRERDQEENHLHKEKKEREFDKSWRQDERVGKRVGNWRDFEKEAKKKSKIEKY